MRLTLLLTLCVGFACFADATAQYRDRSLPIAKAELGVGFSPFGVGNGLNTRVAVAVFPSRIGLVARASSHVTSKGQRDGLFSLRAPNERVVDRALMLAGQIDVEVDAVFTVALGLGQLWGDRLNDNKSRFVTLEQKLGVAAEFGAYMPNRHSGLGTAVIANVNRNAFVVGFVLTFYVGM